MAKIKANLHSLQLMSMLAAQGKLSMGESKKFKIERESNFVEFSSDELSLLEKLSGRDKKKYVKELMAKYKKPVDNAVEESTQVSTRAPKDNSNLLAMQAKQNKMRREARKAKRDKANAK